MRSGNVVLTVLCGVCWLATAAWAHLCDDVWRQVDKLVLKPEVTNLVVSDKAEFDVHMQSTMDGRIACRVRLVGESQAFRVTVTPADGFDGIQPGQRYVFHVVVVPLEGVRSGTYPLLFRLVGSDTGGRPRELTRVVLGADAGQQPARRLCAVKPFPADALLKIDGDFADWRPIPDAVRFAPTEPGSQERRTFVKLAYDEKFLYVGFGCAASAGQGESVTVWLADPQKPERRFSLNVTREGAVALKEHTADKAVPIAEAPSGLRAASLANEQAWLCEMAIPCSLLDVEKIQKDSKWFANFVRESKAETPEVSCWSGTPSTCQDVSAFGELVFVAP